jgi:mRNA-degrading endonuclease RelE of RelBE toxin-antitoxin system
MGRVVLSRRAERDLRRIGSREPLARVRAAFVALESGVPDIDRRPLVGHAPWHRLRVGDYRVLYRPVAVDETVDGDIGWLVARVVHRRDLVRAVASLEG